MSLEMRSVPYSSCMMPRPGLLQGLSVDARNGLLTSVHVQGISGC